MRVLVPRRPMWSLTIPEKFTRGSGMPQSLESKLDVSACLQPAGHIGTAHGLQELVAIPIMNWTADLRVQICGNGLRGDLHTCHVLSDSAAR